MTTFKEVIKKYWPDALIFLGLIWFLLMEYRSPIADWQLVDGQIVGNSGYQYDWPRMVAILLMVLGLDALIRGWRTIRKDKSIFK